MADSYNKDIELPVILEKKILGYKLVPIYDDPGEFIVNAAVMSCCISGEYLSGHSGAGLFIAPKLYNKLQQHQFDHDKLMEAFE